jgi:hypothetical protein
MGTASSRPLGVARRKIRTSKYNRRSGDIEAIQYNEIRDYLSIMDWFGKNNTTTLSAEETFKFMYPLMLVNTKYGWAVAEYGDYIVIDGPFTRVCKRDVFLEVYGG